MITLNKLNTNQEFINITVNCMLNPKNRDMYLGYLTPQKIESLITKSFDNDPEFVTAFWTAFGIAHAKFLQITNNYLLDDIACEYAKHGNNSHYGDICPNCLLTQAQGYQAGVTCPNCDYED